MIALLCVAIVGLIASESRCADKVPVPQKANVGYRREKLRFKAADGQEKSRQLDLWYPTDEAEKKHNYRGQIGFVAEGAVPSEGPHPVLLFSHGYLGVSDQSIFLTEACARAGYIVAAMNHADSLGNRPFERTEPPKFTEPAKWTEAKFRARHDDLKELLDQLLKWNHQAGSPWEGRID